MTAGPPSDEDRRRREEVFGDVLPDSTRDERDGDERSEAGQDTAHDEWLRRQVPPHHG